MKQYTIDAKGKILGRVASQIALILRGKDTPTFAPHRDPQHAVTVINARLVKVSGQKDRQKLYKRYSGYPSGQKEIPFARLFAQSPKLVLEHAIKGMLPKNRLSRQLYKHVTIYNGDQTD